LSIAQSKRRVCCYSAGIVYVDVGRQYEAKRSTSDSDAVADPAHLFQTHSCRGIRDGHPRWE